MTRKPLELAVEYTPEARDDLKQLKRTNHNAFQAARSQIGLVSDYPEAGDELRDEWEGCFAVHFEKDAYRLIWEPDYERGVVVILRANKKQRLGATIYQEGRPQASKWPPARR